MTELTAADVREFQELVYSKTGKRITPKEAREQATNLILFVEFLLRPPSNLYKP